MSKITKTENSNNRDPMFAEAARLMLAENRGSTSSIQRKFGLGYARAGRIMDELVAAGIVAPLEVIGKPRKVLVDERELEVILEKQGKRNRKKVYKRWQKYAETCENEGGWLLDQKCDKCGGGIMLFGEYDAELCPICNEWKAKKCGDPKCRFCSDRPETPSEALLIYEAKQKLKHKKKFFFKIAAKRYIV